MKFESQLQIVTAAGVPPFTVNQTALVINLNADLLDGQHGSYYAAASSLGNYLPLTGGTLTGTLTGTIGIFTTVRTTELTSLLGSNGPITITPDGTGHVHINSTDIRLGPNNTNATLATRGTGDLILRTNEGSAVEGFIRIYDGANGNIEITPNGTGTVVVGKLSGSTASFSGQVTSTVATGTAPLVIASTTAVANLNADLLDGQHGSYYQNASNLNAGTVPSARLSGSYSIDITGNAGSSSALTTNTGSAASALQYWQLSGNSTLNPNTNWWYALRLSHGDADTYYSATIAVDFFNDEIQFRRKQNNVNQTWRSLLHSGNFNSYALPLTGGTITGQLSVNGSTASDILRLYTTGSTVWKLGVTDASGSFFNITADFGNFTINKSNGNVTTPGAFVSTVATGTAPLSVTSTTVVGNLNSDLLDGQHGSYFENRDTTAVGFSGGTLTLTRAAGNLTASLDGRYLPLAGGAMTGSSTISGDNHMTFGPNSSWGSSIRIGGNGYTATGTEMASVVTTDGNLHLDAAKSANGIYLNWYGGTTGVFFGNGASGQVGRVDGSGNASFSGAVTSTYGSFGTPGIIVGDAQYGLYTSSGHLFYKSASTGNHIWRNIANSADTMTLDNSGNLLLSGSLRLTDATTGISKSGGRLSIRSESTDDVANFASYGLYLPKSGQTAGLYVESAIEARAGIRIGTSAANGTITVGADTANTANRLVQRDGSGNIAVAGIRQGPDLARPLASWGVAGTSTGMVIFSFPGGSGNYGMVHCVFDIYEYNSNTVSTVIVGGHNWNGQWYNTGSNVIGRCGKTVRLGFKDGKYCVVFGGAASSWEYGTIVLRKIHNGAFYTGIMDMGGAFTTSQTATESFTWVTGDLRVLRSSAAIISDDYLRGTEVYASNWFRNDNSGTGIYNSATSNHFYSDGPYWNVAYSGTQGIRFRNGHNGTILGYIYAETDGNFGLLSNNGGWAVQVKPGGGGNLNGTWTINSNTPLTSANYSGYALPLTGGTLTGALTINATGSVLGTAYNHSTYFGGTTAGSIRGSNEGYIVISSNSAGTSDKSIYLNSAASIQFDALSHYRFNKPSTAGYQTVALFGTAASGLFLTTDSPIISTGAYYNNGWIATAASGTLTNYVNGAYEWSTFSGATVGSAPALVSRMTLSNAGTLNVVGSITQNGNQVLHAGNYTSYTAPNATNLPYSWSNAANVSVFSGAYSYNSGVAKYLLLWPRTSGATGTNGRLVDGMLKVWRGANHAGNGGTVGYVHASSGYSGQSSEVLNYTQFTGQGLLYYSVVYNSVEWMAISMPVSDYRWEFRGHYGIQGDTTTVPILVQVGDAGVGAIVAQATGSPIITSGTYQAYSSFTGTVSGSNFSGPGTGLTGLAAGLSIGGNAATATNGFTSKPGWAGNQNLIEEITNFNLSKPSGFYQGYQATNSPSATWYNLINVRHSNTANDHGFQLAMSYYDETLWSRSYQGGTGANNGTFTTWRAHLHSGNYSNYALPLTGGTLTGNLSVNTGVIFNRGSAPSITNIQCSIFNELNGISNAESLNFRAYAGFKWQYWDGSATWMQLTSAGLSITGTLNATGAITQGGNQVLHAGNFNSYAMLTTGIPSGSDQYVNFRVIRNSAAGNTDGMYIGYGNAGSGRTRIYSEGSTTSHVYPDSSGNLFRSDGAAYLHSSNYSSYALPLSGGTMTGDIVFANDSARAITNAAGTAGYRPDDVYGNTYMWNQAANAGWYGDFSAYYWRNSSGSNLATLNGSALNSLVALQQNGNQVLHAGNYTNYALGLSDPNGFTQGDIYGSGNMQRLWGTDSVQDLIAFRPPTTVEYTTDNVNWIATTISNEVFSGKVFGRWSGFNMNVGSNIGAWTKVRMTWVNFGYHFFSHFTLCHSTNGHSMNFVFYKSDLNGVFSSEAYRVNGISSWPGYTFTSHVNVSGWWDTRDVRMVFELNGNNGPSGYPNNAISIGHIGIMGGYSSFNRVYDWDGSRNITLYGNLTLPGNVTAPRFISNVATGTAPLEVTSTTLVTNLNAQYLNGQLGSYYAAASSLSSYLPLTGGTLTGILNIQSASDNQLLLQGTDTWAGIGFRDSANVTDFIWYWGATQTFAIGGGGSAGVSGKKLHIDGGVTIGSSYEAVSMPTNGLNVEGAIQQGGNQVLHAGNYSSVIGYTPAYGTGAYQTKSLDTVSTPGLYQYDGGFGGTKPPDNSPNYRTIEIGNGNRFSQIAMPWDSDGFYFRRQQGSTFTSWRTVLHDGNFPSLNTYGTSIGNTLPDRVFMSNDANIKYAPRDTAKAHLGLTAKYANSRPNITGDANYWTGVMGWGTTDWNSVFDWGSGFTDSWSSPANNPGDTSHHLGIQSVHYTNGSARYGWQMVNGVATGKWWLRDVWGGSFSSWREILHSANYMSYALPLTGGTVSGLTSFTASESINAKGIRGQFTNEYLHLYNKVGVGHPSGWGSGEANTPANGLSTYGGMRIAYGNSAASIVYGALDVQQSLTQGGSQVLHAANFTSYAAAKDGINATGTWPIAITGAAGSVPWSGITSKPTTFSGYGISDLVYGNTGSRNVWTITNWNQTTYPNAHFLSSEGGTANAPSSDFIYGLQTAFHRDGASYRTQMVTELYSSPVSMWVRNSRDSDTWTSWAKLIHSLNYTNYAVGIANNSSLNTDSRNTRGVTRLYRRDDNSDYSVQTYWTGSYWRLYGYAGDSGHADTHVGYADSAGSSASCSGSAAQLNGQAASYYENRDTTSVSISAGTLTLGRGAGNLTTTLGGRTVAWCEFNGNFASSQTPNASFNVSSITKNATGDYTINFSSALANTNYVVAGYAQLDTTNNSSNYNLYIGVVRRSGAKATGSCRIGCEYPGNATLYDSGSVGVAFIAA